MTAVQLDTAVTSSCIIVSRLCEYRLLVYYNFNCVRLWPVSDFRCSVLILCLLLKARGQFY